MLAFFGGGPLNLLPQLGSANEPSSKFCLGEKNQEQNYGFVALAFGVNVFYFLDGPYISTAADTQKRFN